MTSTASAIALATACAVTTIAPASAIPYRDDVGDEGSQDFALGWDGVVQIYLWEQASGSIYFNCTGSLINARTVLTAAHCFNDLSSESYGFGGSYVPIVAYGPDTFDALFNWINTGSQFVDDLNGMTFAVDTIIHPDGAVDGYPFPASDVAMLSLLDPLYTLPTYGMLFSPVPAEVLEGGVLVNQIGYGTSHAGSTDIGGIDGKRRAGENMLGLLASQSDFFQALARNEGAGSSFPSDNQLLYWTDFDLPGRTGECTRGADPVLALGDSITCSDWDGFSGVFLDDDTLVLPGPSIDYFPGDALDNEVATGGGDSGGPLMAMNIYGSPLILGVLSGGFLPGFFHASGQVYGEVSYYNPLFSVHDFISENNPYKYVSAVGGDGVWSDPSHWVQTLDPNYFIYRDGEIVNGLPDTPEEGVGGTRPIWGDVFDTDVGEYDTADNPSAGAQTESAIATDMTASGHVADAAGLLGSRTAHTVAGNAGTAPLAALTGPGSTGFVPDNFYGIIGTEFENPAQFFEVTLDAAGTTTLDMNVEIDKLTIRGSDAALDIADGFEMFSLINTEVFAGGLNVDGHLLSRELVLWGGQLTGNGLVTLFEPNLLQGNLTFQRGTLFNIAGTINPGAIGDTGTLSIAGDYVQSSAGLLVIEYDANNTDLLRVSGDASLAGGLGFVPLGGALPRYGDGGTFLSVNGTTIGEFQAIDLPGVLRPVVTYANGQASFSLQAQEFFTQTSFTNHFQANLAAALDDARDTDYDALADLYGPLDLLGGTTLNSAFDSLAPYEAVMFDRTARTHVGALNAALMGQLGGQFGGTAGELNTALNAAERQINGFADTQSLGGAKSLFRRVLGVGETGTDRESGVRFFGDIGLLHGTAELIYGTGEADINGHFTLLGVEATLGSGWSAGLALGLANSESDSPDTLGRIRTDAETAQISAFASYRGERMSVTGFLNTAEIENDAIRAVNLGGMGTGSTAQHDASSTGGGITFEYDLSGADADMRIIPTASLEYASFDFDAFTTQAGAASLNVSARDTDSLIARLGTAFVMSASNWRPIAYLGVAQELGDGSEYYSAAFASAPSVSFGTAGDISLDTFWIEAGFGVEHEFNNGSTLAIAYRTEMNRDYLDVQGATLSYSMPF